MPTLNWIGKEAVVNHHLQVPFHLLKDVPDPQLRRADWSIANQTQVKTEIPVAGYYATLSQVVTDYSLYRTSVVLPC